MNTLINEPLAKKLSFNKNNLKVNLTDGRVLSVPLVYFPRLKEATQAERENYIISGGGIGLHWENIDEDINVKNLLLGIGDQTQLRNKLNNY